MLEPDEIDRKENIKYTDPDDNVEIRSNKGI